VILLDLMMPEMNGAELREEMRGDADLSAREGVALPPPRPAGVLARLDRSPRQIADDWSARAERLMRERTAVDYQAAAIEADTLRRCAGQLLAALGEGRE